MSIIKIPINVNGNYKPKDNIPSQLPFREKMKYQEELRKEFIESFLSPRVISNYKECNLIVNAFIENKFWKWKNATGESKERFCELVTGWLDDYKTKNNSAGTIKDKKDSQAENEFRNMAYNLIKSYITIDDNYLSMVYETLLKKRDDHPKYRHLSDEIIDMIVQEENRKFKHIEK